MIQGSNFLLHKFFSFRKTFNYRITIGNFGRFSSCQKYCVRVVVIPSKIASAYVHIVAKLLFAIAAAGGTLSLAAENLEIQC